MCVLFVSVNNCYHFLCWYSTWYSVNLKIMSRVFNALERLAEICSDERNPAYWEYRILTMIDNSPSALICDKVFFFLLRELLCTLHKHRTRRITDNIPSITTSDNVKLLPPGNFTACAFVISIMFICNMRIGNKRIFTITGKRPKFIADDLAL